MAQVKDPPQQGGQSQGTSAGALFAPGRPSRPANPFRPRLPLGAHCSVDMNSGRGRESPGFSAGRSWPCPALWWGGPESRRHVRSQM